MICRELNGALIMKIFVLIGISLSVFANLVHAGDEKTARNVFESLNITKTSLRIET